MHTVSVIVGYEIMNKRRLWMNMIFALIMLMVTVLANNVHQAWSLYVFEKMICINRSFFLSFFSLSFSFFLFYVCTTHILTLRINVQKNDEYVTTAFVWLLLARFFSSSSIYIFLSCCVVVLAWLISFVVEVREKNCSLLFRLAMLLLTEWKCYKQRERERKRRKKKRKEKNESNEKNGNVRRAVS